MFKSIGTTEVIVVAVVLFVLFIGNKLPSLSHGLGEAVREFRKSLNGDEGKK